MAAKRPVPSDLPRGRIRLTEAAEYLALSTRTVSRLIARGVLTRAGSPGEWRRGRRALLWRDEVELLAERGEDATRDYRRQKGRMRP